MKRLIAAALILATTYFPLIAAEKKRSPEPLKVAAATDPNDVDYEVITRIRQEGFRNSKVMETASYLTDSIGPRLTNSPNMRKANAWTRDQLKAFGLENAHLEPWGPFGRGWSYESATVRMVSPDTAELLALPKAWTPSTNGLVRGSVVRAKITKVEEIEPFRGKLAGKIVLMGEWREPRTHDKPEASYYDEKELATVGQYGVPKVEPSPYTPEAAALRAVFARTLNKFMEEKKPLAVIELTRPPGDQGVIFVQGGGSYRSGEPVGAPSLVMGFEHWGRINRLLDKKTDVQLEVNVKTNWHDDDAFSYNTIAEIPGTDLKNEVVMLGAHLDSWHTGTGATDNVAGCAVTMEAVRMLKAIGVRPRRTIRIALWTGEEEGLFGSRGYVKEHLASRPENTDPAQKDVPAYMRKSTGPLTFKPEYNDVSIYFNLDSGTGKVRGVFLQENQALAPIFKKWMEPFADLGMNTITMRNTGGSDFLSFDAVGVPGIDFLQDTVEYDTKTHHSNMAPMSD